MSNALPKVQRIDGSLPIGVWIAILTTIVALIAVIVLMLNGTLFSPEPKSDLERDYEVLLQGVKKAPEDPAVLMTLAEVEFDLGKRSDAWTHADAALRYSKKAPGFQLRYAQLKVKDGDTAGAEAAVGQEIEVAGTASGEPYFLLAQIQAQSKQFDKAVTTMEKGLKISPQAADMRVVYGAILEDAGRKKQAIVQYQTALKYLPDNSEAVDALKRLGAPIPKPADSPHGQ